MKSDWILIANGTHARLLQQKGDAPPVIVQGFTHAEGRARVGGPVDDRELHRFAHELAESLERHAQLGNFNSLAIFAAGPFLAELRAELGPATLRPLTGTHEVDLTSVGPAELQRRMAYELAH